MTQEINERARRLFDADAERGQKFLEPGDSLPTFDQLPPHIQQEYFAVAGDANGGANDCQR